MAVARVSARYVAAKPVAELPPDVLALLGEAGVEMPTGEADASPEEVAEAAAEATAEKDDADLWAVAVCATLFAISAAIAFCSAPRDWQPAQPGDGLDAFALFYVAAFVLERLLEPLASLEWTRPGKHEIARDAALREANAARDHPRKQEVALSNASQSQAAIDRWRADRALIVLGLATLAGCFIALWLHLDFLAAVGVTKGELGVRVFATALVIGGGTKPLHDLITRIQKAKDNAKDPAEVGGNA